MDKMQGVFHAVTEAGGTLKFGKGVMGKSSVVIVFFIFLTLAFVIKAPWWAGGIAIITVLLACLHWFNRIMDFSIKHPDIALLEGAEWSAYSIHLMGQKGEAPKIINGEEVPSVPKQKMKGLK
ncbi:hypothetical protein KBD71_03130 [Candidatus Woesebacteria bacterium]|nr:hypothetical protein [Candidatus Woesebacteria bacterium]